MKTILMATDLSARSDRALGRSVQLARQLGAALRIVHVVDDTLPESITLQHEATARSAIRDQLAAMPDANGLDIQAEVIRGLDVGAITERADQVDAGLVVLGIHRHGTPELFRGTTAERVVRYGLRPVLVVKDPVRGPYRTVLAAVDLSTHAQAAVSLAARLAPRGTIHMLHVAHRPFAGLLGRASHAQLLREERERVEKALSETTRGLAAELGSAAPRFEFMHRDGDVCAAIREKVELMAPDLLALGTHGRTGFAQAIIGSVAESMLARAPVDVLAVKAR